MKQSMKNLIKLLEVKVGKCFGDKNQLGIDVVFSSSSQNYGTLSLDTSLSTMSSSSLLLIQIKSQIKLRRKKNLRFGDLNFSLSSITRHRQLEIFSFDTFWFLCGLFSSFPICCWLLFFENGGRFPDKHWLPLRKLLN